VRDDDVGLAGAREAYEMLLPSGASSLDKPLIGNVSCDSNSLWFQ